MSWSHVCRSHITYCVVMAVLSFAGSFVLGEEPTSAKSRSFRLNYDASINELPLQSRVRVWLPVPVTNEDQTVKALERRLPAESQEATEPKFGNQILYFETTAGANGIVELKTAYRVTRCEAIGLPEPKNRSPQPMLTEEQRKRFLAADDKVPVGGKPMELLKGTKLPTDPIKLGRLLYNLVDDHMIYDKSRPGWGKGDAVWACDSGFGNCTDFHSLFISLARANGIPSRFEIGFSVPEERGEGKIIGYHCWAHFFLNNHGWVPVDISEADKNPKMKEYYFGNLTENRITLTSGRDLTLVPHQAGPPLNFFVFPYVEVDGKPWPNEKIKMAATYKDE